MADLAWTPEVVSKELKDSGDLQNVFKVLSKNDHGKSVMFIHKLMKKHNLFPKMERQKKTESKSESHRNQGNSYYKKAQHGLALQHYNLALMHAPTGSKAMKLAYGNRSALFFEIKKFKACLKDIEAALSMGDAREPKLIERRKLCLLAKEEERKYSTKVQNACLLFSKITGKPNESIPCASSAVKIEINNSKRTLIAASLIKPGDIVAVEHPFISHPSKENQTTCCYYCLKFNENLVPCDFCCCVMFCDEECRNESWKECHQIECEIMSVCGVFPNLFRLSLKTLIKARNNCNSWEQLMQQVKQARNDKGYVKVDGSDKKEYDSKYYQSICILPPFENSIKVGRLFNMALFAAIAVNGLSESLLKDVEDKEEVMKFMGNQLVYHAADSLAKHMSATVSTPTDENAQLVIPNKSIGHFALAGLLGHSCNPNIEYHGLNNKLVMVAVKSINPGSELLCSFGMSFMDANIRERKYILYKHFAFDCKCEACADNWITEEGVDYDITKYQDELLINSMLKSVHKITDLNSAVKHYKSLCEGLAAFQNKPKSKYYWSFYKAAKLCQKQFQYYLAPQYVRCIVILD